MPSRASRYSGALLIAGQADGAVAVVLGLLAVVLSTINVVGGFMVTDRMLGMFRRDDQRNKPKGGNGKLWTLTSTS